MLVTDLGRVAFDAAWAIQEQAVANRLAGGPDQLFLVEHDPVVTLGRHDGRDLGVFSLITPCGLASVARRPLPRPDRKRSYARP